MNATSNEARDIFLAAIEISSPGDRQQYLDRYCGNDFDLRTRVEKLISSHEQLGTFHESSKEAEQSVTPPPTEQPGTLIGPYKLLQQIGEGGMGVVFMAEQERPVQRTVALKIIKPGMDTRQVIARFEAERQALALMDHPNIARVLDAGTTDTGRPYFVMDLVKGVPITEYCDAKRLTVRERLELFRPVCEAVQHAHQKGIIHRDLKPSNVLVAEYDGKPIPKIIDFGVAKATAQKLTERTMFTEFGQLIGTFEYMSPEQASFNQLDVDTRSDIYSLGVLLYELLTGSTPFEQKRLREAAFDEVLRIIREEEPPKPSTRIARSSGPDPANTEKNPTQRVGLCDSDTIAANRQTEPARLSKDVRGELDWIVMRSLEKDRQRRYQTANELTTDIERYLTDQPVEACPPSAGYRLKKFVYRNKVGVVAGVAIAFILFAGAILTSIGFVQARREAARADLEAAGAKTQAARSDEVARFLKDMLEGAGPSVALGRDATILREILDKTAARVESDLKGQPQVRGDLLLTLGRAYADINDETRAIELLKRAVDSLHSAGPDDTIQLALAFGKLGALQSHIGDCPTGRATARQGLDVARRLGDPATLAECLYWRAHADAPDSQTPPLSNAPRLREAIAIWRQLGNKTELASCLDSLGSVLGFSEEAESTKREALDLMRKSLPPDHPNIGEVTHNLARILLFAGNIDEAERLERESVATIRKLYGEDNGKQIIPSRYLVGILARQGKWAEAESLAREGIGSVSEPNQYSNEYPQMLVRLKASQGDFEAAIDEGQRLVRRYPHDDLLLINLTMALLQAGRHDEYRRQCRQLLEQVVWEPNQIIVARTALLLPVDSVDFERACQWADELVTDKTLEDKQTRSTLKAHLVKSLADYRRQRFDSALDWAQRGAANPDAMPFQQTQGWLLQAMSHLKLNQPDAAAAAFALARDLFNQRTIDFIPFEGPGGGYCDWAVAQLLYDEAAELLGEPKSKPLAAVAHASPPAKP